MSHKAIDFTGMNDEQIKSVLLSLFPLLRDQDINELVDFVKEEEMRKKTDLSKSLIEEMQRKIRDKIDRDMLSALRESLSSEDIEDSFNEKNINLFDDSDDKFIS